MEPKKDKPKEEIKKDDVPVDQDVKHLIDQGKVAEKKMEPVKKYRTKKGKHGETITETETHMIAWNREKGYHLVLRPKGY